MFRFMRVVLISYFLCDLLICSFLVSSDIRLLGDWFQIRANSKQAVPAGPDLGMRMGMARPI